MFKTVIRSRWQSACQAQHAQRWNVLALRLHDAYFSTFKIWQKPTQRSDDDSGKNTTTLLLNRLQANGSHEMSFKWRWPVHCILQCVREGSMDPYSRAPRSPKFKQQTSKVFFDTGLTTGPQVEECKSPSVEQVGLTLSLVYFYMFNWLFDLYNFWNNTVAYILDWQSCYS